MCFCIAFRAASVLSGHYFVDSLIGVIWSGPISTDQTFSNDFKPKKEEKNPVGNLDEDVPEDISEADKKTTVTSVVKLCNVFFFLEGDPLYFTGPMQIVFNLFDVFLP